VPGLIFQSVSLLVNLREGLTLWQRFWASSKLVSADP